MVRNIVGDTRSANIFMRRTTDNWSAGSRGGREAALEPAPGDIVLVEQIANVRAAHRERCSFRRAGIIRRVHIEGICPIYKRAVRCGSSIRLTGDQIERTRSRWSKGCAKGIIAHGKVLSIVPEGRD